MNLTQFAENLMEALGRRVDPDNWMERLENVLYALEYGKQREAWRDWDAMQREADMEDVEYSSRVLMNPISHCPPEIEIQKKRLEKEIIYHLNSLSMMPSSGELADGDLPIFGWPDPWGIFEKCKDFAEWIAEEMGYPLETSAPPMVGDFAERIAEEMGAPSETSASPEDGKSDEGIGQGPQDCEADNEQAPDPKACADKQPDTVKHPDEGKPGYVSNPPDIDAYMPKKDAINEAPCNVGMTGDILEGMLTAQKPKIQWTRPLTKKGKPHPQRKLIHGRNWAEAMKPLCTKGVDGEESHEDVKRRMAEIKKTKQSK